MIRIVGRKGNSSRTCGACYSTHGRAKRSRDAEGARAGGELRSANTLAQFAGVVVAPFLPVFGGNGPVERIFEMCSSAAYHRKEST